MQRRAGKEVRRGQGRKAVNANPCQNACQLIRRGSRQVPQSELTAAVTGGGGLEESLFRNSNRVQGKESTGGTSVAGVAQTYNFEPVTPGRTGGKAYWRSSFKLEISAKRRGRGRLRD